MADTGVPSPCWMVKPLSKITDAAAAGQNVLGGLFRGLKDDKWEKRHVSIIINHEGKAIVYGRTIDKKDKKIKFDTILSVRSVTRDQMLASKCPSSHASKGWMCTTTDGKEVLWAVAESEGESLRDEWVDYLHAQTASAQKAKQQQQQQAAAAAAGASSGGKAVSNKKSSLLDDDDDDYDDDDGLVNNDSMSIGRSNTTESVVSPQHKAAAAMNNNHQQSTMNNFSRALGARDTNDDENDEDDRDDDHHSQQQNYVDEDGNTGVMRHKSQKELNRLAGGGYGEDDDIDIDNYFKNGGDGDDDDDIDLDDLDDDDDYDTQSAGGLSRGRNSAGGKIASSPSAAAFESKEQLYKKVLIPIAVKKGVDPSNPTAASDAAWEKNNYIYLDRERMKNYKAHLLSGDVLGKPPGPGDAASSSSSPTYHRLIGGNIRFARFMIKIAKRDNYHERDVVITDKRLYLFTKASFGRWISRVVEIDQIVGVIESTTDPSIFAVIVPSFHDVFLKVKVGENNVNNDSDKLTAVEVKRQIIAHLYCAHLKLVTNRNFIFREAENVAAVIRRTEDDQHLPLLARDDDRLRIAVNKDLYPALRTNADTIVYMSCYCERISQTHEMRKRGLVLTDNAIYTVSEKLDDIARRTGLSEIHTALYNMVELKVLFKGGETDTLVAFRTEEELVRLMELVGMVTLKAVGKQLEFSPHGNLFSQAQLVAHAKLLKFVTPDMSQQKIRKMFRQIGTKSVSGVGLLGSGMKAMGGLGFQTIKTVGKGVGGVIVDNAIAGEFIGMLSAAGNAMVANNGRLLFERILTVEDEEKAIAAPKPFPDRLQLAKRETSLLGEAKAKAMGDIYFSSRCKVYNLSSHIDTEKAEQRIACVSSEGGLTFFVPHDNAGWGTTFKKLFVEKAGLAVSSEFRFSELRGIITCDSEPTVIGLQTSDHCDTLIRLPNETSARQFARYLAAAVTRWSITDNMNENGTLIKNALVSANGGKDNTNINSNGGAAGGETDNAVGVGATNANSVNLGLFSIPLIGGSKSEVNKSLAVINATASFAKAVCAAPFGDTISPFCYRTVCPIYSVASTAQLKFVLRKTLLDPHPTIACRANATSDTLLLSRVPQLIEVSRRYGDNTIHFSSVAWRFRKSTARKGADKMINTLDSQQTGDDRKHFKSFVLMLTNTAIYDCTKGNYSITRRIPFRKISKITLSTEDPDALLLHIPSEFDAVVRIEGRRKEFMDRLQEVYLANWTEFNWYQPNEIVGSHNPTKYFFPVALSKDIVRGNDLTTPKDWQARQGAMLPTRVADATRFFYEDDLRRAVYYYKAAISAAAKAMASSSVTIAPADGASSAAAADDDYFVAGFNRAGNNPRAYQRGSIMAPSGGGGGANNSAGGAANTNTASPNAPSWDSLWFNITSAASRLQFAYKRAYSNGVRPNMVPAQRPAAEYDDAAIAMAGAAASSANAAAAAADAVPTSNKKGGKAAATTTASSAAHQQNQHAINAIKNSHAPFASFAPVPYASSAVATSTQPFTTQPMALCAQKLVDFADLSQTVRSLVKALESENIGRYDRLVAYIKGGLSEAVAAATSSSSSPHSSSSPAAGGKKDGGRTAMILCKLLKEQQETCDRLSEKRRAVEEITNILEGHDDDDDGGVIYNNSDDDDDANKKKKSWSATAAASLIAAAPKGAISHKRRRLAALIEDAMAVAVSPEEVQRLLLAIDSKLQGERIVRYLMQYGLPPAPSSSSPSSGGAGGGGDAVPAEGKGWTLTERRTLLDACGDLGLFNKDGGALNGGGGGNTAVSNGKLLPRLIKAPPQSLNNSNTAGGALIATVSAAAAYANRGSCEAVDVIVEALHYGIASGNAGSLEETIEGAKAQLSEAMNNIGAAASTTPSNNSNGTFSLAAFRLTAADIGVIESEITAAQEELNVLRAADAVLLDLEHLRHANPSFRLYDYTVAALEQEMASFGKVLKSLLALSSQVTSTTTTNTVTGYTTGTKTTTSTGGAVHASGGQQLRRVGLQIHIDVCQLYMNRIDSIATTKREEEAVKLEELKAQRQHKSHVAAAIVEAKARAEASEAQRVLNMHERLEADVTAWAMQAEEIYKGIQKAIADGTTKGSPASPHSPHGGASKSSSAAAVVAPSSSSSATMVNGVNVDVLRALVRSATTILENLTSTLRIHPQGYEDTSKISTDPVTTPAKLRQRIESTGATISKIRSQLSTANKFADRFIQVANNNLANAINAEFGGLAVKPLQNSSGGGHNGGSGGDDHKDTINIPPSILRAIELQDKAAMVEAITRHNHAAAAANAQRLKKQQQQQQQADGNNTTDASADTGPAAVDPNIKPLNMATLTEIKRLWLTGSHKRQWVAALHKSLTGATAMGNAALLKSHLDRAAEKSYSDDIVQIAARRHKEMVRVKEGGIEESNAADGDDENAPIGGAADEEPADDGNDPSSQNNNAASPNPRAPRRGGAEKDDEEADGSNQEDEEEEADGPPPMPVAPTQYRKPAIIPLEHAYDTESPFPSERIVADLLLATMMMLRDCNNVPTDAAIMKPGDVEESATGAKTPGAAKIVKVPESTAEVKTVVNLWVSALEHSVKPSGIFKKVPRTLYDVLKILGDAELPQSKGSLAAPYTNRIVADFERVKEFNSPNGCTAQYFLMSFILYRGCLVPLLTELLFSVPLKARSELFLEGALMRSDKCFKDVMSLAYMCEQVEWSFAFVESNAAAAQQRRMMANAAASPLMPSSSGAMGGGNDFGKSQSVANLQANQSMSMSLSFLNTPTASPARAGGGAQQPTSGTTASAAASPQHGGGGGGGGFLSASPSMSMNMSMRSFASPSMSNAAAGSPSFGSPTEDNDVPLGIAANTVVNSLRQAVKLFGEYYYEGMERLKTEKRAALHAKGSNAQQQQQQRTANSSNNNNNNAVVVVRLTPEDLSALLDERANKGVALVIRNAICPAIAAALSVGYRHKSFMSKRYLWEFIAAAGAKLKESMRDLQAVAIPDGIDLILNITDPDGRNKIFMNRLTDEQVAALRFRMFVVHLLNTGALHAFLSSVFADDCAQAVQMAIYQNPAVSSSIQQASASIAVERQQILQQQQAAAKAMGAGGVSAATAATTDSLSASIHNAADPTAIACRAVSRALLNASHPLKETPSSLILNIAPKASKDQIQLLHKYYRLDRCLLLCMNDTRKELLKLAATLSKLKFSLCVDAEVW